MTGPSERATEPAPASPHNPADPARRRVVGAIFGAGLAVGSMPACAQEAPAPPPRVTPELTGLKSIMDFIPKELHAAILVAKDTTDLTRYIQAALDTGRALWAPADARFHVTQLVVTGVGRFIDFNNATFVGIATAPTSAVIVLKCGHSEIRGLRVGANRNMNYRAAVRYFTDDVQTHPVGYNRFWGGQVDGALIGLWIGGPPDQRTFRSGKDPAGAAVDAPLSESTFRQWNTTGCIRGLYINQPNGKLQFLGCHLAGETADWHAADTPRDQAAAIVVDNPGSEISVVGGSVEQLQEKRGRFVEVHDGTLTIADATIETVCASYVSGAGRLSMARLLNGGFNSVTASFIQARGDCTGRITLSDFQLLMPPANRVSGSNDLVTCVAGFDGPVQPAPGLIVDLSNVELREVRWSGGGADLYPLVRGARVRFDQCRLTWFTSDNLRRLGEVPINDQGDRLGGVIDRSAATLPGFAPRGTATAAGWRITAGPGARWGSDPVGGGRAALRLTSGPGSLQAATAPFAIDRNRLFVLRAACRFSGRGRIAFHAAWLDFAGKEIGREALFDGPATQARSVAALQWMALNAVPPAGAERAILIVTVGAGADLTLADPSIV